MVPTEFHKYMYCPFELDKCFQKPLISASKTVQQLGATTINFVAKDVCSWKLVSSESDLYFSRYFNITIDTVVSMECHILYGPSFDQLTGDIDCSNTNSTIYDTIQSTDSVVIVARGFDDMAYL